MKIGDMVECSIWMDGLETPLMIDAFKADLARQIEILGANEHVMIAPLKFKELHVFDDRVPEVPDHIQGINVRLLYASAEVVSEIKQVIDISFLGDLDLVDLERLRAITRQTGVQYGATDLSDEACDAIIEEAGPDAAHHAVKQAVDSGAVH